MSLKKGFLILLKGGKTIMPPDEENYIVYYDDNFFEKSGSLELEYDNNTYSFSDDIHISSSPQIITKASGNIELLNIVLPPNSSNTISNGTTTSPCFDCCPLEIVGSTTCESTTTNETNYIGLIVEEYDSTFSLLNSFTYINPFLPNINTQYIVFKYDIIVNNFTDTICEPC